MKLDMIGIGYEEKLVWKRRKGKGIELLADCQSESLQYYQLSCEIIDVFRKL